MSSPASERIFVVDDDEAVRDSLRALLEAYGYEVEDFASGDDFLDRYGPQMKGCVVLDVNMPGADGFSVLSRIGRRTELPVLLATARADAAIAARATAAGAAAFLEKPFQGGQLLDQIRRVMPAH